MSFKLAFKFLLIFTSIIMCSQNFGATQKYNRKLEALRIDFEKKISQTSTQMENRQQFMMNLYRQLVQRIDGLQVLLLKSENESKCKNKELQTTPYKILNVTCADTNLPKACYQVSECIKNEQIFNIRIPNYTNQSFPVACDLNTALGDWTVIQRRQDGSVNFFRNWTEYVAGFGDLNGEFFIGLEKLHILTVEGKAQELYILMEDFQGQQSYAYYVQFAVHSKDDDYSLTIAGYSGNASVAMLAHNGQKFSTWDRDNDEVADKNCAKNAQAAWWYKSCGTSSLNGLYTKGHGIVLSKDGGPYSSLKYIQLMIRPRYHHVVWNVDRSKSSKFF